MILLPLKALIFTALNKIMTRGDLSADLLEYFFNEDPKFVDLICYRKSISDDIVLMVDQ